ncbi:MAG: amidohydrolase family protein [Gammaproteobacteria bacterium]|nr:amidohydrolase family protein [Gammaproteobacteria bacterium]
MPEPAPVDLAIKARWVVPVTAPGEVLEDHVVVIDQGRIADVVPEEQCRARYDPRRMGGSRLPCADPRPGQRSYPRTHDPDARVRRRPAVDGMARRAHLASGEDARRRELRRHGARLAIAEMLLGGTTCFNDMYFHPEVVARTALDAGIRACLGMIVLDMPTRYAAGSSAYIDKGLRLHDDLRHEDLVTTAFAPHAPYTVEDAALTRLRTLADELDVPVHMHVHETAHEVDASVDRFGVRPLERLAALGLATPRLLAVHMTQLMPEEIRFLAAEGVHVVHCPQSNLKLASGMCPLAALVEAGVNVALGTDGAASNNDLDMFEEMRVAALLAKGVSGSPVAVPARAALEMATINGARALGLDHLVGTIEAGKAADLVAVDLSHPRTTPVHDAVTQLVYSAGADQVSDVWVAGRRLLNERRLTTIDMNATLEAARAWVGVLT